MRSAEETPCARVKSRFYSRHPLEHQRMAIVEKSVLVEYSAMQMFDLVERVEDYPKFLPWCAGAEIVSRQILPDGEERTVATLRIDYRGVTQSFTTDNVQRRGEYIRMTFKEGPFHVLDGGWLFRALRDDACKVEFRLHYEFSSRLLDGLIGPVFSHIAGSFVDGFTRRAEAVHG